MAALLALGGAYALASWDWCGRWEKSPATLVSSARATGALRAGAAAVPLEPPYPVTVAGYGPVRSEAAQANRPLQARAVVLQVGEVKAAIVALDVLLIPDAVVDEVRVRSGLPDAWVVATHSHSSMGGYDPRPLAELAGTGRYRDAAKEALVRAATQALQQAQARLGPAQLGFGRADVGLCRPRSGSSCDGRLSRLQIFSDSGPIAEWLVLAAHPTLVGRKTDALDPDYPGALADRRLAEDAGVALVLQGAGGNSMVPGDGSDAGTRMSPAAFAEQVDGMLPGAVEIAQPLELALARVQVALPHPDASRLVPAFSRVAANNFVCLSAARTAEVSVLRLGSLVWLAVPVEVSRTSGALLEKAARATGVVSLANGYLGYLEPANVVSEVGGESKRQYYGGAMITGLDEAAELAGRTVR